MLKGQASYLIDDAGVAYLDSRNNVAILGHQHPVWLEAVCRQLSLTNTNSRYLHPARNALEQRLLATFPPSLQVCFLVNSGSEATELALRLAHAKSGRTKALAVEQGYHGVTLAAMRASPYKWPDESTRPSDLVVLPMDGKVSDVVVAGDELSCMIVESALSVGGVRFSRNVNWLSDCFAEVRARGGVCICDEVQVGLGRTGKWFWAFERDPQCVPDIVTIGKGLGNGFPVAAVVCTRAVADALDAEQREVFSTFGGNPVACQAALAVLDVIAHEQLQARALRVGQHLLCSLQAISSTSIIIKDVRGQGLFVGVEFASDAAASAVSRRMYDDHCVLTSCDGPVMVIKPPFSWGEPEADKFCAALHKSLQ